MLFLTCLKELIGKNVKYLWTKRNKWQMHLGKASSHMILICRGRTDICVQLSQKSGIFAPWNCSEISSQKNINAINQTNFVFDKIEVLDIQSPALQGDKNDNLVFVQFSFFEETELYTGCQRYLRELIADTCWIFIKIFGWVGKWRPSEGKELHCIRCVEFLEEQFFVTDVFFWLYLAI